MFTSTDLKAVIADVRPIIERQLDDATVIAGHREKVTAQGGDWSQVKALVKAMIQDERDESGGHKRVLAILHKADHALGYADMLGLGNLNEKNSFAEEIPPHDADGVILETIPGNDAEAAENEVEVALVASSSAQPIATSGFPPSAGANDDRGSKVPPPTAASVVTLQLRTHDPETHFLSADGLKRLHGCLRPNACAGSWRALCHGCDPHETAQGGGAA